MSLFPLWHGTRPEVLDSVLNTGFANLATTDDGFFGKGLYIKFSFLFFFAVLFSFLFFSFLFILFFFILVGWLIV